MSIEYECALEIREGIRQLTEAVEQLEVRVSYTTSLAEQIFTRLVADVSVSTNLFDPKVETELQELAIYALRAASIFAGEKVRRTHEQA